MVKVWLKPEAVWQMKGTGYVWPVTRSAPSVSSLSVGSMGACSLCWAHHTFNMAELTREDRDARQGMDRPVAHARAAAMRGQTADEQQMRSMRSVAITDHWHHHGRCDFSAFFYMHRRYSICTFCAKRLRGTTLGSPITTPLFTKCVPRQVILWFSLFIREVRIMIPTPIVFCD